MPSKKRPRIVYYMNCGNTSSTTMSNVGNSLNTAAEYVKEDPVRRILEKVLKQPKVSREERSMLKALHESYLNLLKTVIHGNLDWSANVGPLKAKAAHLTSLAGIGTFLCLLQIAFLAYLAPLNLEFSRTFIEILSYFALLVDAFSAIFSVLASGSISLSTSPAKDYSRPRVSPRITLLLDEIDDILVGKRGDRERAFKSIEKCKKDCDEERQVVEKLASSLKKLSRRDAVEYPLILVATSIGTYLFVVSLIVFIGKTQHLGVSLAIGSFSAVITILLIYLHVFDQPGIRTTLALKRELKDMKEEYHPDLNRTLTREVEEGMHRSDPSTNGEDESPPNKLSPHSESTTDEDVSFTREQKGHDFDHAGMPRRKPPFTVPRPPSQSVADEDISVPRGEQRGRGFDRPGIPRRKVSVPDLSPRSESASDEEVSVTRGEQRERDFDHAIVPRRKLPVPVPRRRNPYEEALEAGLAELSLAMKADFDRRRDPSLKDSDESSDPLDLQDREGAQSGPRDNSTELNEESTGRPQGRPASNTSNPPVTEDLRIIAGDQHGKTSTSDQPYIAADDLPSPL